MTAPFPNGPMGNVTHLRPVQGEGLGPQANNLDAELIVLSSLILGDGEMGVADVRALLRPEHFYDPAHRHIYAAILALTDAGSVIDLVTISAHLRSVERLADVGGTPYITKVIDFVPAPGGLRDYVRLVVDTWAVRQVENLADRLKTGARRPVKDAGHFIDAARKEFEKLGEDHGSKETPTDLQSGFRADLQRIVEEAKNPSLPCPTGVDGLNRIMRGGWWNKKLVILGARPSTGKTALALESLLTCAQVPPERGGGASLLFSLELDAEEIRQRLISIWSGLSASQVRACQPADRIEMAMRDLWQLPLFVDDQARTPSAMRASIRRHQRLAASRGLPLRLISMDYLSLADPDVGVTFRTDEERVAIVSREFVSMRKTFKEATFLVLAQLNRQVTGRKDARPKMSDLRGSGQIEQDADTIAMLFHENDRERENVTLAFDKNRGLPVHLDVHLTIAQETGQVSERTEGGVP